MFLVCFSLMAETVFVNSNRNTPVNVRVNHSDDYSTELELNFSSFEKNAVKIDGKEFNHITLGKEGLILEEGMPQLPFVGRSIIIPDYAKMNISVVESDYTDYQIAVAPSKGSLLRNVNPEDIPYTFGDIYNQNQFYPSNIATLGDPYIMRDYRGITVGFSPVQYNAHTNTLRVYHHVVVKVVNTGIDTQNVLNRTRNSINKEFKSVYASHFLNFNRIQSRYVPIEEEGTILVITHPNFLTAIQPYVNWKRQKGYQTELVTTETAGTSSTAIKTYIQNYYTANPNLAYIQLVGDAAQIPTLTYAGGGSDPSYVMLAGNDNYPELFIGRFSAETVAHVETQVERTIWYERDIFEIDGEWIKKGTCIASNEGGGGQGDMGESDIAHQNLIRTDLLNYGYTSVDQAYAPSITAATLLSNFNQGRGFVNYTGHGDVTYWVTSNFSNTHVNQLTNEGKLPFIVSVACVNGNFTSTTCFGEAWLRATNNTTGAPTGAMVAYMSTINQPWNEPMRGQDVITDLMVAQEKFSIGGLYFNGSSAMLDAYNNNANSVNTMKTWIIFGDASLIVRNDTPFVQTVNSFDNLFIGMSTYDVQTDAPNAMVSLYNPESNEIVGSGYTDENGSITLNIDPQTVPCTLKLTVTAPNAVTFIKDVAVIPNEGAYIVYTDMSVALTGNNSIDYNTTSALTVNLNNVGNEAAQNLTAVLRSLNPFITVNDSVATITEITAEGNYSINNIFNITSAANSQDAQACPMQLIITDQEGNTWTSNFNIITNAPLISTGAFSINDTEGNNNGRLDPGETVILSIPIQNTGHAASEAGTVNYVSTNPLVVIQNTNNSFNALAVDETANLDLTITAYPEVPTGSSTSIGLFTQFGQIVNQTNFVVPVGLKIESFESGDFTAYPWVNTSSTPWTIVNTGAFDGTYAAKSANTANSSTSFISVVDTASTAGVIKFAYKVSSEASYDKLKFYIDGVLKNDWSGDVAWTEVEYNVTAGVHTYKWEYSKDTSVNSGSDCAWVDKIIFPNAGGGSTNAPLAYVNTQNTIEFGSVQPGETVTREVTIVNFGNVDLTGTITVPAQFFIGTQGVITVDYIIPAQSNQSFMITFYPETEGVFDGTINITTNDTQNPVFTVQFTANCIPNSSDIVIPKVTKLQGNYPNPFNPNTNIAFSLKENSPVTIDIYNVKGQLVKQLVNAQMPAGHHSVNWNGKDNNQKSVSSGVYFYRMQSKNYSGTKKMLLMK